MFIEYLSDVLSNLHFLFIMTTVLIGFLLSFKFLYEQFKIDGVFDVLDYKLGIKIFIIFLILSVFTPTTLKYGYVKEYINKNAELESENKKLKMENDKMHILIKTYYLEDDLKKLSE